MYRSLILFSIFILFTFSKGFGTKLPEKPEHNSSDLVLVLDYMDINNIDLPCTNEGLTGDDGNAYYPNGQTQLSFLFNGGYATTGFLSGQLRASWMAEPSLIYEWQPGIWGMDPNDPLAKFYVVTSNHGFGSQAYQDWANAVNQGAEFQDLNGDGVYNPNVDRPPLVGNRMSWCAYNDNTPMSQRTPRLGTPPIELLIHQTVWAFNRSDELGDIIFFRYRLINPTPTDVDGLIFSIWDDPDLGDFQDDLVGCDTTLDLGYCYNDGDDNQYGVNPPAFGIQILQGPVVPSPGDSAFVFHGPYWQKQILPDYKNLPMTSYMFYIIGNPFFDDPSTAEHARNYQEGGKDKNGNPIDPTQWGTGGTGATNPKYIFSGDPVNGSGWLCNTPADMRFLVNCGPFHFAAGDTQDIIISFMVGMGSDALQSLQRLKDRAQLAKTIFQANQLTGIETGQTGVPHSIELYQNYPNPFNPETTIEYLLHKSENIDLSVYNTAGQVVRKLVNGTQAAGEHRVVWDGKDHKGNQVASGIYLYRITAGNFIQSRKMLLLR